MDESVVNWQGSSWADNSAVSAAPWILAPRVKVWASFKKVLTVVTSENHWLIEASAWFESGSLTELRIQVPVCRLVKRFGAAAADAERARTETAAKDFMFGA